MNPNLSPFASAPPKCSLCWRDWGALRSVFPQLCFLSTNVSVAFLHGIWEGSSLGLGWKMHPWCLATVSEILEQPASLEMTENVRILTCPVLFFNLSTFSWVQTKCFLSIPCCFCIYGFKRNLSKSTTLTLVSSPHALNTTLHTQPLAQNL